jgi:hypothetical protein
MLEDALELIEEEIDEDGDGEDDAELDIDELILEDIELASP